MSETTRILKNPFGQAGLLTSQIGLSSVGAAAAIEAAATPITEPIKARNLAEKQAAAERERIAIEMRKKVPEIPDEAALQRGRKRSLIESMRRRGRASTIMTDPTDALGA